MANYRKEEDATFPASKYHSSSRRTPSFSSSSSSSSSSSLGSMSYFPDDWPLSTPATPHRFSGIPFSWERLPGVPKNKFHSHKKNELSRNLVPPPPSAATKTPSSKSRRHSDEAALRKKTHQHLSSPSQSFRRDPFYAAFVECSKDGDGGDRESDAEYWMGPKVGRSSSDRFGLTSLYGSCKNGCAVSESIVYVPRPRRGGYGLISNRSR